MGRIPAIRSFHFLGSDQAIPKPSHSTNELWLCRIGLHFGAQTLNMNIYGARIAIVRVTPNLPQ